MYDYNPYVTLLLFVRCTKYQPAATIFRHWGMKKRVVLHAYAGSRSRCEREKQRAAGEKDSCLHKGEQEMTVRGGMNDF